MNPSHLRLLGLVGILGLMACDHGRDNGPSVNDTSETITLDRTTGSQDSTNDDPSSTWEESTGVTDTSGTTREMIPQDEPFDGRLVVVEVAVGENHSCAVLNDGSAKCWGKNTSGQLGSGDADNRGDQPGELGDELPRIHLGEGAIAVSVVVGEAHSCALLRGGTVKCWGNNDSGQLGLGDTASRGTKAEEMGDNLPTIELGTSSAVIQLAAGRRHTCARFDNRMVKCWGDNSRGQLGLGDTQNRGMHPDEMGEALPEVLVGPIGLHDIVAGAEHTCVQLFNQRLKCWGAGSFGQLGLGDSQDRGDQPDEMGVNLPVLSFGKGRSVYKMVAGDYHNCVLLDDYTAKCWGKNDHGQLGLGDTAHRGDNVLEMGDNLPVVATNGDIDIVAGADHTCSSNGYKSIKCWGKNDHGQLGLGDTQDRGDQPGETVEHLPWLDLGDDPYWYRMAAGGAVTCVSPTKCWGNNEFGQLGLGDTDNRGDGAGQAVAELHVLGLGNEKKLKALTLSDLYHCAILEDGSLTCWGPMEDEDEGCCFAQSTIATTAGRVGSPLRLGPALPLGSGRRTTAVVIGENHACALLDNGSVKCWGYNDFGQLGRGDRIKLDDYDDKRMGDALRPVDLGKGRSAMALSAGSYHTCALLDNGTVKCWGRNDEGQLGLGDVEDRGDEKDEMGDLLPSVALGHSYGVKSMAAGIAHTCVLFTDGVVKCWGRNTEGQLGLGDDRNRGNETAEMGYLLPQVKLPAPNNAVMLTAGGRHTCVMQSDGQVNCWGSNNWRQLGIGWGDDLGDERGEMGKHLGATVLDKLGPIQSIAAGVDHHCALDIHGAVKCWGDNSYNQLGVGLERGRKIVTLVAGEYATAAILDDGRLRYWGSGVW